MESIWDMEKIQSVLPQRYPFLFIDGVMELSPNEKKAVCVKNVSINDYFFEGHFPGNPIMPGVIIIEAMAQASIVLYASLRPEIAKNHPNYYLGKVECKFKKPVRPGDLLILEAHGDKVMDKGGIVSSQAKVDGEIVAEAQIVFGVAPK